MNGIQILMLALLVLSFSLVLGCEDDEAESCDEADECVATQQACVNEAAGDSDAIGLCAAAFCECLEEVKCDAPDLSNCGSQ